MIKGKFMPSDENMHVLLVGRAAVYRILQNLIGNEPNEESLQQLVDPTTREVLGLFSQGSANYQYAFDNLYGALERGTKESGFLRHLEDCFNRLFVGPGAVEAPPWESVHLNKENTLFQPSTLDVRKAYVASGFIPQQYPHVADDHIAIELDFLARLAERAEMSLESGDTATALSALAASEEFLRKHLMKWVHNFAASVAAATHAYFYQEVAAMLAAFLPVDLEVLAGLQDALDKFCDIDVTMKAAK
jgi:TorA maturation chaperone TorD